MQITQDNDSNLYHIKAYEAHFIQVNEEKITHHFAISPTQLLNPWSVNNLLSLQIEDFQPILALKPEVILVGTGQTLHLLNPQLLAYFMAQPIGVEVMNTPAACRTYIALAAEGRKVVAALLLSN